MDFEKNLDKTYKKLFKNFSNGIIHNVILWIISKQTIHGYGIMKKLEEFFSLGNDVCEVNINSSKIYPILNQMESNGLIVGEWNINENNKSVKFYSITDKGNMFLKQVQENMNSVLSNPSWIEFFKDMTGMEINNEKCN